MSNLENARAKIKANDKAKSTNNSKPSAVDSLIKALPLMAVIAGVTGACQSEEGRHKPDNSKINTVEQNLSNNDVETVESLDDFQWSIPGDLGLQIFFKNSKYIGIFENDGVRNFVISDSFTGLTSALSPTFLTGSENLKGGRPIYHPIKDKLLLGGTRQTTEDVQAYDINLVGNSVSITNKQDACDSHVGNIGNLGQGSITNNGKIFVNFGGAIEEVDLATCTTIPTTLNPEAGIPDQDPTLALPDNSYIGAVEYSPGVYVLAKGPTVDDLKNKTNLTYLKHNNAFIPGSNVNIFIDPATNFVHVYFETATGFKVATIETNCGDGVCVTGENATTCVQDCEEPVVCGDGTVEGTELCDDENCNANCDDCNPGYELSGNLCVAQIPDEDPDLSDTTDADPDTVDPDTIDDTDTVEDTDTTTDTPDEDTPETTDTPDQDTSETDTTPDQSNPEIIIDPNCDPTRIAVTDVLASGSGVEVLCPGSPVFAEIKGNGTLSLTLHEGISPATVQIGDMEGNEGKIIINESVKEGEISAEMDQIYGYYRFQEDEKLANGQPQLEVNYRVTGAIMTFSPIGTIFEMDKKSLDQNNIKYAGRVIESSVLATVFDENDKLLYTRVFQEGDEIYFTNTSLKSLCNESTSDFCKVIVPEDTSEGAETLEGEDVFTDTSVDKKDPGGCTCIVKSADGKLEVIPAALGLAVLGIIMQLRRRKETEK